MLLALTAVRTLPISIWSTRGECEIHLVLTEASFCSTIEHQLSASQLAGSGTVTFNCCLQSTHWVLALE